MPSKLARSVLGLTIAASIGGTTITTSTARAEQALTSLEAVHAACRAAEEHPAGEVLVIEIEPGWTFGTLDEEGFLTIEPRRSFRALGGRVELMAARLETIGLVATPERLDALEQARRRGARLRVGFFIGFDEPDRTACLLRSRHAVTTVRMDVAFVELLGADGGMLAREDTDRYRAWQDDHERQSIPGQGPRGAVGDATAAPSGGAIPEPWRAALSAPPVRTAIGECHRAGIARGAHRTGRVVARLRVDGRTGRALESAVAVSDLGDPAEAECVATALRGVVLPVGAAEWARVVDLSVPVRLTE